MYSHGIQFINRIKTDNGPDVPDANKVAFSVFSAACANLGVSSYIKGVMFDGSSDTFAIDVPQEHEFTAIGDAIERSAKATFDQYELFGCIGHKDQWE